MITRSKSRKAQGTMAGQEQQTSVGSEGEWEINNQMGVSELFEAEEISLPADPQIRAEGRQTKTNETNQADDFQTKLFAMLQNMQENTQQGFRTLREETKQSQEELKQNLKQSQEEAEQRITKNLKQSQEEAEQRITKNLKQSIEELRQEQKQGLQEIREETRQSIREIHEKLDNNNKQLLEKFENRVVEIRKQSDQTLSEYREELKTDRNKINQINEKVDRSMQAVDEVKQSNERVLKEVTKTSKMVSENNKRVEKVEGNVTRTREDLEEKVRKLEEEKAKKIGELKEVQEAMKRRLTEVESRPVTQVGIGERLKDITFKGDESYPMEFLKELDEVKEIYHPEDGVNWISRHLEGDAMIWWRVSRRQIESYTQFKEAFTEKYWGAQTQERIRDGLEYGKYQEGRYISMIQYAERKILQCRQLIPPLTDQQIIKKLARHFNQEVEVAVITRGITRVDQFETLLGEFMAINNRGEYPTDLQRKFKYPNRERRFNERMPSPVKVGESGPTRQQPHGSGKNEGYRKPTTLKHEHSRGEQIQALEVINQHEHLTHEGSKNGRT
jgi:myosin heavy subunit